MNFRMSRLVSESGKQSCDLEAKSSLPQRLSPASLPPFLFIINAWGEEDQMPL
jgi:hypothetical protein